MRKSITIQFHLDRALLFRECARLGEQTALGPSPRVEGGLLHHVSGEAPLTDSPPLAR